MAVTLPEKLKNDPRVPTTPLSLLVIALLFVPGVYLIQVLAALLTVAVAGIVIGGLGWLCAEFLHRIPVGAFLLIGLGALIGIFAVLKGIVLSFWRRPRFEPAWLVDLREEPHLREFIEHLCAMVGAKTPTCVVLHAEDGFFVQQGGLRVFNGKARGRVLALSLPLLSYLTTKELRAILAHEFAHFTGRDTLYSAGVLPVYTSAGTTLEQMTGVLDAAPEDDSNSGLIGLPLLLPCLCLGWYLRRFHRLNMKLSRSREHRADAIAALCCGSGSFSRALEKATCMGPLFSELAHQHITNLLNEQQAYVNYYEAFREMLPELSEYAHERKLAALAATEGEDDSHPPLSTRLGYIPQVPDAFFDEQPALSLLIHRNEYECSLTKGLTYLVAMARSTQSAAV